MLNSLENIVIIGDRILIKPLEASNKTGSGLYLPPSVKERDAVHTGLVVKVGPGYPIPASKDPDDLFKNEVKEGDEALYLHAGGYELEINNERYIVVSQNAILLVLRNEIPDSVDNL